jgi:hypothetical protein
MICVNVYAQDYGNELISTLSKPNEFYVATAHIDGNASTQGDAKYPAEVIPDTELPKGWRNIHYKRRPRKMAYGSVQVHTLSDYCHS